MSRKWQTTHKHTHTRTNIKKNKPRKKIKRLCEQIKCNTKINSKMNKRKKGYCRSITTKVRCIQIKNFKNKKNWETRDWFSKLRSFICWSLVQLIVLVWSRNVQLIIVVLFGNNEKRIASVQINQLNELHKK